MTYSPREYRKHVSVSSPALLAGGALKTALMSAGVKINGAVRYAQQPMNFPKAFGIPKIGTSNGDITVEEVTTLHSPPLSYILKTTFSLQLDIKAWDIFLADGSGLSRANMVSAKQVVKLLQ